MPRETEKDKAKDKAIPNKTEERVKIRPRKVLAEPKVGDKEWEAVTAYLEWWDKLPPKLQKAVTDYPKVRQVRQM